MGIKAMTGSIQATVQQYSIYGQFLWETRKGVSTEGTQTRTSVVPVRLLGKGKAKGVEIRCFASYTF